MKFFGKTCLANRVGFHTTKLTVLEPQDMIRSSDGSLTRSKVLDRNAGTGFPCKHSSGCGKLFNLSKLAVNWEEDEDKFMVENA